MGIEVNSEPTQTITAIGTCDVKDCPFRVEAGGADPEGYVTQALENHKSLSHISKK